jgi:hypothetical protein
MRRLEAPALAATLLFAAGIVAAQQTGPFVTNYTVQWRGMQAGTSTFTFRQQNGELWSYESRSSPRGLFKAFLPANLTQHSDMRIGDAGVQPLRYRADDGTAATKRDIDLQFDWQKLRVTGTSEDRPIDEPLEAGVQDDLSVQIALIHELAAGRTPAGFKTFNNRGLREYQYLRVGEETLQTPLGAVATIIYSSQRAGSNRVTRYWCAPSLGFLPLKAQQKRGERVEWTMDIRSLTRS